MAWWLRDKGGCTAPSLDTAHNGDGSERYRSRAASLRKPVMRVLVCVEGRTTLGYMHRGLNSSR